MNMKRGVTIWLSVGALLLAWFGFSTGVNAGTRDRASEELAQEQKVEHFYRVVSGELTGSESGPANKLARDLRELPFEDLDTFMGDSNRYGGISDDLGFDPFDGVDCSECGRLDSEVILYVQEVKNGNLNLVIQELAEGVEEADLMSRPGSGIVFLWVLSLPVGIGILYVLGRRSEESRYREFSTERRLVSELREARSELPPGTSDADVLDAMIVRLEDQIEMRVNYKKSKTQEMKLDHLMKEANATLGAITAGNRTLD